MPPELYTILGTGLGTIALIAFYLGRHHAEMRERHDSNTVEDLKSIRFEIRASKVMPSITGLYHFLDSAFESNPALKNAEDILLNTSYGPELNDLVNELERLLVYDARVKEDWQALSACHRNVSRSCYVLALLSIVGIPLIAVGAVWGDRYWSEFITAALTLAIVIVVNVLMIAREMRSSRSSEDRYRQARNEYLVDKLRS